MDARFEGVLISLQELRFFKSALSELRKIEKFVQGELICANPALFYQGKIDTLVVIDGMSRRASVSVLF